MIDDIGMAVIHNGAVIMDSIVSIANSMSKGIDYRIIGVIVPFL